MSEKAVQQEIFKHLGGRFDVRLFRNNVGTAWMGDITRLPDGTIIIRNPRRVVFGLHKGSADLIGWQEVTITPAMVGRKLARFVAIEVKGKGGRVGPLQENFLRVVSQSGGAAGVARSAEEALALVGGGHGPDR